MQWADALESGRFTQGKGTLILTTPGDASQLKYCCLGVACVLYEETGAKDLLIEDANVYVAVPEDQWDGEESDVRPVERLNGYVWELHDNGNLPKSVQEWLGVDSEDPMLAGETAINRNDDMDHSFPIIADAIRREIDSPTEGCETCGRRVGQSHKPNCSTGSGGFPVTVIGGGE